MQGYPAETVEFTTENGAINQLEKQITAKKENLVFNIKTFRQQFDDLLINLTSQLEDSKNRLTESIENVTNAVDYITKAGIENGNYIISICKVSFDANIAALNSRVPLGFVEVNKFLNLKKIPKQIGLLAKQIANYKKVIADCKTDPPVNKSTDVGSKTAESCGTTRIESADNEVSDIVDDISETIKNVETTVRALILAREDEIETSLSNIVNQINACLN